MTYLLGLTGSIGMGKSTTAQMFADAGIPVWDADAAVHRIYDVDGAAVKPLADAFEDVLTDNAVDRAKLKQVIAADDTALKRIESIVHPLVAADRAAFIATSGSDILLFDIPLLFETKAEQWLNDVVVVSVDPATQRDRVLARGTMTPEQFEFILSRQMPDQQKRERARWVIETTSLDVARIAVDQVIQDIRKDLSDA